MKTLANPSEKNELLARLQLIQPSTARNWGKMSAHQMICHLSDGFRLYMGLKQAESVNVPLPRWLLKWTALWVPRQWPQGYQSAPELDQLTNGTPPSVFKNDVQELQELLDRFTRQPRDFSWPAGHPHFGAMSERDWMRLAYLHMDHHLRQFGA